jgi:hypothetical protein
MPRGCYRQYYDRAHISWLMHLPLSEHLGWMARPFAFAIPPSMPVRILQGGVILASALGVKVVCGAG